MQKAFWSFRMPKTTFDKNTKIVLSLSSNPGNFGTYFHNELYRELNLNYFYKANKCRDIEKSLSAMKVLGIHGCSVSMPYKKKALKYVDSIDSSVKKSQSTNTIINTNSKLRAFNTDLYAFHELVSGSLEGTTLIIGSGAIAQMIINSQPKKSFHLWARNRDHISQLISEKSNIDHCEPVRDYHTVINATPLDVDKAPFQIKKYLHNAKLLVDYPVRSPHFKPVFLKKDQEYISGFDLTILQAIKQFELYTKVCPTDKQINLVKKRIFRKWKQ